MQELGPFPVIESFHSCWLVENNSVMTTRAYSGKVGAADTIFGKVDLELFDLLF